MCVKTQLMEISYRVLDASGPIAEKGENLSVAFSQHATFLRFFFAPDGIAQW
jgi:hypothetical protein